MKTCTGCGETKALEGFHRRRRARDGRGSRCKVCTTERMRRYYEENREEVRDRHRRYREENREKVREKDRRYYEENREEMRERDRRYREENREKVRERNRRYREENRDRLVISSRRAVDPLSREGFVYRLYDGADRLLYVGLTYDPARRFWDSPSCHSETKPWWPEVTFVWVEHFDTYADAQEAERHAITEEAPIHNVLRPAPTGSRPEPIGAGEYDLGSRSFVPG